MKKDQNLDVKYDFFSGKRAEDIIVLSFKENLLHRTTDLDEKALLLDYLDLVSKSDGILGSSKASKVLLSDKDISADEALRLGIVEQVVPSDKLNEEALRIARDFAQKPLRSMLGIKRLLNCCMRDLENCLKCEDELLSRIINEPEFREKLREYKYIEIHVCIF